MKKYIFLALAIGSVLQLNAQKQQMNRSFVNFNIALSVPIACYASQDLNKASSGFAKPGLSMDVTYGHYLTDHWGVSTSLVFGGNKVRSSMGTVKERSYCYYAFTGGPFYITNINRKWAADFRFNAGFARAYSPGLVHDEEILMSKNEVGTFVWTAGAGIQYNVYQNTWFSFRMDHLQMKPQFGKPGDYKTEQHIVAVNPGIGLMVKF